MSSLSTIRLNDGSTLDISEWLHDPLYSAADFTSGDQFNLDLFSYTVGQNVTRTSSTAARIANAGDTNLVRARQMNQDEAMVVYAIAWEMFQAEVSPQVFPPVLANSAPSPLINGQDLAVLQRDTLIELKVGAGIKKPQVELPLSQLGMSLDTRCSVSTGLAGVNIGSAGEATPANQQKFKIPVFVGGTGENARPGNSRVFHMQWKSLRPVTLLSNGSARFFLDGLRKRPA